MGKDLVDQSEIARERFHAADEALGFPLSKICFEGPDERLTSTEIAQPALLTVSTICFDICRAHNLNIVAAAGHSLGEYSALVAAEAIAFKDAVTLVHKRGMYMQEAVPRGIGKMVAVLGKERAVIEDALANVKSGVAGIANDNAPGQIVVAGLKEAVDEFLVHLGTAKSVELAVSAPFHCALMKPAEELLRKDLAKLTIREPKFPVYSNFYARALSNPDEIREALGLQVCGRVRWVESMERARAEQTPDLAVEFGYGAVLSGLMKRIAADLPRQGVSSIESADALSKDA